MEKIKVIHDLVGRTLTVWVGDPKQEFISEETADEVVHMKDKNGKIIGMEILNYTGAGEGESGIAVESIVKRAV
jgi:hypothetical protein